MSPTGDCLAKFHSLNSLLAAVSVICSCFDCFLWIELFLSSVNCNFLTTHFTLSENASTKLPKSVWFMQMTK